MKSKMVVFVGILLSFVTIFILASAIENGDINAASMYFVVFLIPILLLAILNGLYIRIIEKLQSKPLKAIACLIPIVILWIISLNKKNLTIQGIDGNLVFAAKVGAIALGLTNILWLISILIAKPRQTNKFFID